MHIRNFGSKIERGRQILHSLAEWVVVILAVIIITFLTLLVFRHQFNSENSIPIYTNILLHVFISGLVLGVCKLIGHFLNPHPKVCKYVSVVLLIITLVYVGIILFSYVGQTLLWPISDEKSCYDIALRFLNSEFGAVVPKDSYLSLWPYQTGLIFIIEKMMRIFNTQDPLFFQQLNCYYVLLIIISGYSIICMLSKKLEGRILFLLLMANYFPLFFNVSVVYGDLPGLTWMIFSSMCYMAYFKSNNKWMRAILLTGFWGSTILACTYKGNSLIYIIALLLVTFVKQLKKLNPVLIAVVIVTTIISIFSTNITQKYYEHYAGNVCGEGMPSIGWLAMGLQYNGEEAIPGGWNGFHSSVYISSGYDYEEASKIFEASIKESLQGFADDPGFAGQFFYNKVMKQWANQTHGVFWGINSLFDVARDENSYWVQYLNGAKYRDALVFIDYHESVIYATLWIACVYLLISKIKKQEIDTGMLLPVITFIGGFLFSLIWEGQTSAVMSYPIMLLPVVVSVWADWQISGISTEEV